MCQCGRKDGRVTRLRDREGKMGQRREEGRMRWKRELREERVDRSVVCPVGFLFPNSIRRKINLFLDCYTGLSCPTDNLNPGIESLS